MRPARQSSTIGAREAEAILSVSRSKLHALASSGVLIGRIVDRRGTARHWIFRRSDVLALRERGNYLKQRPKRRRQKQLWEQYFGPIPTGYTPAFRDGDRTNTAPVNLCLLPLKAPRQPRRASRKRLRAIRWTKDWSSFLRREYQSKPSRELATELGISLATLTRHARRLHLRKPTDYLREQARIANRLPLGTERVHDNSGTVWVKVSLAGPHYQRWRPKQEVVWEAATGQPVARGWCVIFKDGNKRNFDIGNLELISRRERAAQGFARFLSYPRPLQKVIKLNAKLGREIQQRLDRSPSVATPGKRRRLTQARRWTEDMDAILLRDYPTQPVEQLTETLSVSLSSLRQRARRLQVQRSPETIIAQARAASIAQGCRGYAHADEVHDSRSISPPV